MNTSEVQEAVALIEQKLHEGVASYGSDLREIKNRLKEVEQRGAGGLVGAPGTSGSIGYKAGDLSRLIAREDGFKAVVGRKARNATMTLDPGLLVKNTILGESGSPQEPDDTIVGTDRLPGIVPGAFRALNLLDFIPMDVTSSNKVEYTRESAWTNDAAETAEGATKPESDLTFELVEDQVRTIAHWIKVSRQAWDDSPALQRYLDQRLRHGVRKRLQSQVINGNGTSPNISGLSASGRHTAFSPSTGETALDTLNRAKWEVVDSDYTPNFILMRPSDVGAIERLKRGDSDDIYLASDGAAADYVSTGLRGMIWGLPVIATPDVAAGKFILGDSMSVQLLWRQQAVVEMTDSDSDDFQKNLLLVRAELRAALAVYTPAAILYGDLTV